MKLDNRIPYTYLIGWKKLNVWYYGVRYAKNCHPDDLWVSYFTSSKHVSNFVVSNGEPDVIKVRKLFTDANKINSARQWEQRVLVRIKAVKNKNWLNRTDTAAPPSLPGELNPMYGVDRSGEKNTFFGKHHTLDSRINQSRLRTGIPLTRNCIITDSHQTNRKNAAKKRATKHKFYHPTYGEFIGSTADLSRAYPDQKLRKDEVWRLTMGYNKSYKKWLMSSEIIPVVTLEERRRMKVNTKIILTDVDGVLLRWDKAFDQYLQSKGYIPRNGSDLKYDITKRYHIEIDQVSLLLKEFNNSANIAFLEPLRDSVKYVKKLHEEHGYYFHAITSFGKHKYSQEARKLNLRNIFGETVFEKFIFLDLGEPKDTPLLSYLDTGYWWIEDRIDNAETGYKVGLKSILMEHGHNLDFTHPEIPLVKNWQEIYQLITGEID